MTQADTLAFFGLFLVVLASPLLVMGIRTRTDRGQRLVVVGCGTILTGVVVVVTGIILAFRV